MSIKGLFIMTMEPAMSSATPFSRSNHRRPKTHLALTLSLCILSLLAAHAGQPTNAEESHAWPAYGGGPENTHYSTLAQINRKNVSHLQVAWTFLKTVQEPDDAFPDVGFHLITGRGVSPQTVWPGGAAAPRVARFGRDDFTAAREKCPQPGLP